MNKSDAIQVKDVHKSFRDLNVLDGIDLKVSAGETVVVLGRSGVGKSVLLKLIIGLLRPDSGSVLVHGENVHQVKVGKLNEIRKQIGFLFQNAALYDSMNVEENVAFPLNWHGQLSTDERKQRVMQLLTRMGVEASRKKMPSELSGGMRKRVGLARALAMQPVIMLLDEPTAGLDPQTASEITDLFSELQMESRVSALVVTHDIHTVKAIADRVVMLEQGKVVFEGTVDEFENNSNKHAAEFLKHAV